jgi:hypothetical protein
MPVRPWGAGAAEWLRLRRGEWNRGSGRGSLFAHPGGPIPTLDRDLLVAYGATFVDLRHGNAVGLCADFTPAVADLLARTVAARLHLGDSSTCDTAVGRLFLISGQRKRGASSKYQLRQVLRDVGINKIERHDDNANANVGNFFNRNMGTRIHFEWIAHRWRVAEAPHLRGAFFACKPDGRAACTGAGVFDLTY